MNQNNQKKKIIEIYKNKEESEIFDKERSKYLFQKYKHKIEADFLRKALKGIKKEKIKVLDVACGTGRMLPEVLSFRKGIEYVGLDTSKNMTKYLKEKAKILSIEKQVKVKISDASKLPFKDESFDVVFSFHLLWHLPKGEQEKIIVEMRRVTESGGLIIFDILNRNFIWEKMKRLFGKESEDFYKLSLREARNVLKGIKDIRIEKLNDAPIKNYCLYRIFNLLNKMREVLPSSFYHVLYLKMKK